jgi:O-antigen/teichoic acid export membrane protein
MNLKLRLDAISGPAFRLIAGRVIGGVVSFAIPVVLARVLLPTAFGTYKQLFLIYMTLYGVAQLGAAESLYYFVPRKPGEAARSISNSLATLTLVGTLCILALYFARDRVAAWMEPAIATELPLLGLFLALTLISAAFEIVIVSRNKPAKAAIVYAASDIARTLSFVIPALAWRSLHAVLTGGVVFAGLRVAAMLGYFWVVFGRSIRLDGALWRRQWARTAVCDRGRDRCRSGECASVGRGHQIRRGGVCHLCRRLPSNSARRFDLHIDGERDDGQDGRGGDAR